MHVKRGRAMGSAILALAMAGCGGSAATPVTLPPATVTPAPTPTPSPTPTPTPRASALTQADARIGTCINLGNHLEAPKEGDWGRALRDQDIVDVAAKGFKTIRLPVRFSSHQGGAPDYAIDPAFLDRVEHLIDLALANGLRVIVDTHHFDELTTSPASRTAQLTAIWKQLGERLKTKDAKLWFEILNEPKDNLTHANLVATLGPALAEIRKTNPTRPVVIGGENWSGIYSLATVPIFDDANLIYTFHYYDPFNFTHQGATWITPTPPMGRIFGSQADKDELAANVQRARDFMTRTGRPLFMGEYGANEAISVPERADYYRTVKNAFGAAQVDGCIWSYVNTFPVRDATTGTWVDEILAALGL